MLAFPPRPGVAGRPPHPLHAADRVWPETNCYVDLWIEVLHAAGLEPEAMLPFTVAQDFEGDQFTFFKPPADDLELLYGVVVQELAIYDGLEAHGLEQVRRGRLVLVEVDGHYLPDLGATAYRRQHVKTTIGITAIDVEARALGYFHNAGRYTLAGEDYDGVLRRLPALRDAADLLFPYAEMVRSAGQPLDGPALLEASLGLLARHLRRRPRCNPVTAYHDDMPRQLERLAGRPMDYFHLYAFNVPRQLGANAELLGSYLGWLGARGEGGLEPARAACDQLATDAKALQFQLARAVSRRRFDSFSAVLARMEADWGTAMGLLAARYA